MDCWGGGMRRRPNFAQTADCYLPEFTPDARLLQSAFQATVYAKTPDGEYGKQPDWLAHGWLSHTAAEMEPPPVAHAELAVKSKLRRKNKQ